jgi:patatin-like phospholipase/acyl hydrolase
MESTVAEQSANAIGNWNRFQILSLDGGGFKGLFSAAVLAKLEEKSGQRITDHFDLITGTSTGGLIAIGLGLGLSPREIVQFYVKEGPTVFGNRFGWRWFLQWVWRKFPQSRLKTALQSESAFGDKLLGQSTKRLVIPTYNLGADQVRVFKTPHHPRLTTDLHIPAWKIALATSAAPTYFPACQDINHTRLIDGGVWANNPAMVGVVEAVSLLNVPLTAIKVFSIGTTDSRKSRRKALNSGGIVQWLRRKDVLDVLMRGQSVGVNGLVAHLIGPANYRRIDPTVPDGMFNIDGLTVDDLLAEAEHTALHEVPYFQDMFCGHAASVYTPCKIARAA